MQKFATSAEILQRARIPNGVIVTLYSSDAEDFKDGRNLIATNFDGTVRWRAKPVNHGSRDCFTGIFWDGYTLKANTFSCYQVAVDVDDGSVVVLAFTK
ncbi:hypothetical protein ASG47_19790 [Devosia sp. Leaf420]|uniref:hypothetical protein n=1 Tax=Devosia sp. Leaf420 TaxID=1736374 RepID=UPI0007161970|nr:hypothetical protein [Devosia sp. Leaf420]KQT50235.1 hypothetical protein ASG47_19790 [Devosia sp. Leaf420]